MVAEFLMKSVRMCCLTKFISFQVPYPAYVIDRIMSTPALNASITPTTITLKGFLLNRNITLNNEAASKAAIKKAGAMTPGISLTNIKIESI